MKKRHPVFIGILFFLFVILYFFAAPKLTISDDLEIDSSGYSDSAAVETDIPSRTSPSPEPEPSPEPFEEYDISLMALGDNLMHMGIVNTGRQEDGTYDYSFLFQNMAAFLDASDIRIINQETILGGNELGFSGYPYFNSPTQVGDAIANAGFNIVLHATNHAADQGLNGILNCSSFWKTNYPDVLMVGICEEENSNAAPALLKINDVTFAILNYTYGPNLEIIPKDIQGHLNILCDYDPNTGSLDFTTLNPQVISDIQTADTLADIVIVCPHWGTEYEQNPSSYQKQFALEMTEAGADLILGTHPHVPQPVEWITSANGNTSLCYYSLGNYVSTQKNALSMLEEMAWVTFHVTEDGIQIAEEKTGVLPLVCHYKSGPVRLEQVYLLEDYTEELALRHGLWNYGGVPLHLDYLQTTSEEIFGNWILKRSDITEKSDHLEVIQ